MRKKILKGLTARVLIVSGVITLILGAAFVLLIVAVSGQRDAGRLAIRSQEAITAGNELQKSTINLENGLAKFVASGKERSLEPWRAAPRGYPGAARKLAAPGAGEAAPPAGARRGTPHTHDHAEPWG